MARSPFTFTGALELLDPDRKAGNVLGKILGGALFVGAGAAFVAGGPVVSITAAGWLALIDPKNEAVSLLDAIMTNVTKRLRGTKDKNQRDLVVAAHTITAVSSFFDALPRSSARGTASSASPTRNSTGCSRYLEPTPTTCSMPWYRCRRRSSGSRRTSSAI